MPVTVVPLEPIWSITLAPPLSRSMAKNFEDLPGLSEANALLVGVFPAMGLGVETMSKLARVPGPPSLPTVFSVPALGGLCVTRAELASSIS
jgi:hypothetical protein